MSAAPRGWMKCKVRTKSIHPQPYSVWDPAKLFSHPSLVIYFFSNPAHLSMKDVCLCCFVCTYKIHRTGMLQIAFLVSLESSQWGGVHGLGSMTFGLVVQKFLNIEWFFHWKLN
jgi:hypothetical protein